VPSPNTAAELRDIAERADEIGWRPSAVLARIEGARLLNGAGQPEAALRELHAAGSPGDAHPLSASLRALIDAVDVPIRLSMRGVEPLAPLDDVDWTRASGHLTAARCLIAAGDAASATAILRALKPDTPRALLEVELALV